MTQPAKPRVALFFTCLVDLFRPSVGFAAVKLLEDAGCTVEAPDAQTCCGQPAFNSGDRAGTVTIARRVIETFAPYDYVVAPSGSCAGMIRKHYRELFDEGTADRRQADAVAGKTWELTSFLVDVMGISGTEAAWPATATYHDSCSGLRELGVKAQPRALLNSVEGLDLREMKDSEVCCGFGGTFCVKYPDISDNMVSKKMENIGAVETDLLLAGDLGCLMNMAGKLSREGKTTQVRHVAEVLAGMSDTPAIARAED